MVAASVTEQNLYQIALSLCTTSVLLAAKLHTFPGCGHQCLCLICYVLFVFSFLQAFDASGVKRE